MSGPTKTRREPWHVEKHERVPRKSRVDAATEILGEDQRSDVEVVLDRMDKESEWWKDTRSIASGRLKTFAKRYGAALDRVIKLTKETPRDFAPLMLPYAAHPERTPIEGEVFDHERLLRHLSPLRWFCQVWENSKLSQKQRKAAADDKRVAAWGALALCEKHGIRPTKTKNGKFCCLAAALYGDPTANFLPHCQWVLKERDALKKAVDELHQAWKKSFAPAWQKRLGK